MRHENDETKMFERVKKKTILLWFDERIVFIAESNEFIKMVCETLSALRPVRLMAELIADLTLDGSLQRTKTNV